MKGAKKKNSKSKERSSKKPPKTTKNAENTSILSNISLDSVGVKGVSAANKKTKMLKHQLPGNNTLSDKEQAKLGSRKNRYGVFDE